MTNFSSFLHAQFGFDSFRAGQAEAIQSLLDQQHTLAIMPTGSGKSLIYQLAALQFERLTFVISPLIALMLGFRFVLEHDRLLLQKGALAFPYPFKDKPMKLPEWLKEKMNELPLQPTQASLF